VQEWRQQFQKLESVNLRYDNQVIVNPDMEGRPKQAALAASAAKAAAAAGVKPAALITRLNPHDKSLPKPAFELTEKKLDPKSAAAKKPVARPKAKKTVAKAKAAAPKKPVVKAAAPGPKTAGVKAAASKAPIVKKPAKAVAPPSGNATTPKPSAAIAKQQASAISN